MKRKNIRILFLSVTVILVLQLACIWKVAEPYPAIRFPGFKRISYINGKVSTTKYEILALGATDTTIIDPVELFHHVPKHYIPNVLNNIITKATSTPKLIGFVNNKEAQNYHRFQLYAANRLKEIFKKKYTKLVINKYDVRIDSKLSVAAGDKKVIQSTSILLP